MNSLRPYQQAAVDALQNGDLLVMPTGVGKTITLAEFVSNRSQAGERCLWVAHRAELVSQASNALRAAWLEPELNVWVRSIQELRRNGGPKADWLIWDEAHHAVSDDWSQLRTAQYPEAKVIGASATPERGDGRGLAGIFNRIVEPIKTREAIEQGYLVPARTLRPDRPLGPGELAQDPLEAYAQFANSKKAIIFAPSVELAIQWACRLRDGLGIPAFALWGDMPLADRLDKLESFRMGKVRVLVNVEILTEGTDIPDVECVVLARGFGTTGGYLQAVGRGLRPSPGKKECLVLDLRGASHDHGEVDDDRIYSLDGRGIRKAEDSIEVRFCPVCGSPVVGTDCEKCGYAGELRRRPPRVLGLPLDRFARKVAESPEARAKTFSRWLLEARRAGHKDGRAYHKYRAVYQEPPSRQVQQLARQYISKQ